MSGATSIVRKNLMTKPGYVPYCGSDKCVYRWPRAKFNGYQFQCLCGWRSSFEESFIEEYRALNAHT